VATYQRNNGEPIPVWELRGMFTALAAQGLIEVDAASGNWRFIGDSKGKGDGQAAAAN